MAATGAGMLPRSALTAIANAVRQQNGSDNPYTLGELASAVAALDGSSSGGAQLDSAGGEGLVPRSALGAIADAIRAQNGGEDRYTPLEMPDAILALTWGPARKFWGIYHEDDTLEIAWRAEPTSDLPSPIADAYESDPDGATPTWRSPCIRTTKRVVIAPDLASSPIRNCDEWFSNFWNLVEVTGFEALVNVTSMRRMFAGCEALETVYATSWVPSGEVDTYCMFDMCGSLVGGHGGAAARVQDSYILSTVGDGLLTDPEDDRRKWFHGFCYQDGELVLSATDEPEEGRPLLVSGRLCANARYLLSGNRPWKSKKDSIVTARFADDMATFDEVNLNMMFYGFDGLTTVTGLSNLHGCTQACSAFRNCGSLIELDLTGFDASSLTELTQMFWGCDKLETIWADSIFALPEDAAGSETFSLCSALTGGGGTRYSSSRADAEYMRIDNPPDAPGYLTARSAAQMRALLLSDGTLELNCRDAIESDAPGAEILESWEIAPAGYSSDDRPPWHERRSEVLRVTIDDDFASGGLESASYLFCDHENLVEVTGFEGFSAIATFDHTFSGCSSLETIYASGWAPAVEQTGAYAFAGCYRLVGAMGCAPGYMEGADGHLDYGEEGFLTDPAADAREWVSCHLYSDGELVATLDPEPEAGRELAMSGRMCATARYQSASAQAWSGKGVGITRVTFAEDLSGLTFANLSYWFKDGRAIARVDGLDRLPEVREMEMAFAGCDALAEIDLCGLATQGLENLSSCFSGCSGLVTIWVDAGWVLPESCSCYATVYGCEALVGGAGTAYSSAEPGGDYIRIDNPPEEPGYLTAR